MIQSCNSVAIFSEEDESTPVAWNMEYSHGMQAHLYTLESHRRKGLASIVKHRLCQKMIAEGLIPHYGIMKSNPNFDLLKTSIADKLEFVMSPYTYNLGKL